MEDFFKAGKLADNTIALEIMARLEKQNYFSPSALTIYQELILNEYQRYFELKTTLLNKEKDKLANQDSTQNEKKKGLFGNLFKGDKKEKTSSGGCCNLKIVPEKAESAAETKADAKNKGTKGGGCCGGGSCC
jgi:hypothetical protein